MKPAILLTVCGVALASTVLGGCTAAEEPAPAIDRVVFTQHQAVLGFDDSEHVQTMPAQLERLSSLLDRYGIVLSEYTTPPTDGCTGGITTDLAVDFDDGTTATATIDGCGHHDDFEAEATALFSVWRTDAAAMRL